MIRKSRLACIPTLLVLVLLACLGAASAGADGELRVSVREVSTGQTSAVQVLAKVVDQSGKPVAGLSAANFSLRAGGKDIPITAVQSVTDAKVGISSLLVIDTSGTMVGAPLSAARDAAAQYVKQSQPVDEVGVVSFAGQTQVIADFSQDFAAVQSQLAKLTAYGDTALYDAVADAANRIAGRASARRAVILLTDGGLGRDVNTTSRDDSLTDAKQSGVPFYTIGLGPSIDSGYLQELAAATGGAYFAAPSSSQLAGVYAEIANYLRGEYVVTADFSQSGLTGTTEAAFRAQTQTGNGEVQISVKLPDVPVPAASVAPSVPQPVETPQASKGGDSAGLVLVLLAVAAMIGGVGWLVARRLKKRREERFVFGETPIVFAHREEGEPVPSIAAPRAVLRLDSGEEFEVRGAATLGVDPGCSFRLPLTPGEFGHGELRVWFANQRYMIHDVASRARIRVNGRPVTWSFLGDGDEIDVKGVRLRFSLAPEPAMRGGGEPQAGQGGR